MLKKILDRSASNTTISPVGRVHDCGARTRTAKKPKGQTVLRFFRFRAGGSDAAPPAATVSTS